MMQYLLSAPQRANFSFADAESNARKTHTRSHIVIESANYLRIEGDDPLAARIRPLLRRLGS